MLSQSTSTYRSNCRISLQFFTRRNHLISQCLLKAFEDILFSYRFLSPLCSLAFPFLLYDDRDPEGNDPPSLHLETSDDLVEETKAKRLEDAQGINS